VSRGGGPPLLAEALLALPAPDLAPRLIGCELRVGALRAQICETEAYHGEADRACHAARGRTPRSELLYRAPGTLYCYLCYGVHVLLNIVCDAEQQPSAVLLRSILLERGVATARRRRARPDVPLERLANGPGKLSQALGIELAHNGSRLGRPGCPLRLYERHAEPALSRGPRVGVAYAGPEWAGRPWRWWLRGFPVAKG